MFADMEDTATRDKIIALDLQVYGAGYGSSIEEDLSSDFSYVNYVTDGDNNVIGYSIIAKRHKTVLFEAPKEGKPRFEYIDDFRRSTIEEMMCEDPYGVAVFILDFVSLSPKATSMLFAEIAYMISREYHATVFAHLRHTSSTFIKRFTPDIAEVRTEKIIYEGEEMIEFAAKIKDANLILQRLPFSCSVHTLNISDVIRDNGNTFTALWRRFGIDAIKNKEGREKIRQAMFRIVKDDFDDRINAIDPDVKFFVERVRSEHSISAYRLSTAIKRLEEKGYLRYGMDALNFGTVARTLHKQYLETGKAGKGYAFCRNGQDANGNHRYNLQVIAFKPIKEMKDRNIYLFKTAYNEARRARDYRDNCRSGNRSSLFSLFYVKDDEFTEIDTKKIGWLELMGSYGYHRLMNMDSMMYEVAVKHGVNLNDSHGYMYSARGRIRQYLTQPMARMFWDLIDRDLPKQATEQQLHDAIEDRKWMVDWRIWNLVGRSSGVMKWMDDLDVESRGKIVAAVMSIEQKYYRDIIRKNKIAKDIKHNIRLIRNRKISDYEKAELIALQLTRMGVSMKKVGLSFGLSKKQVTALMPYVEKIVMKLSNTASAYMGDPMRVLIESLGKENIKSILAGDMVAGCIFEPVIGREWTPEVGEWAFKLMKFMFGDRGFGAAICKSGVMGAFREANDMFGKNWPARVNEFSFHEYGQLLELGRRYCDVPEEFKEIASIRMTVEKHSVEAWTCGDATHCCMSFGAGNQKTYMKSKAFAFLLTYVGKQVVAQSVLWQVDLEPVDYKILVLDNVEVKSNYVKRIDGVIDSLYQKAVEDINTTMGQSATLCGLAYNDFDPTGYVGKHQTTAPSSAIVRSIATNGVSGYGKEYFYSDAHNAVPVLIGDRHEDTIIAKAAEIAQMVEEAQRLRKEDDAQPNAYNAPYIEINNGAMLAPVPVMVQPAIAEDLPF
jgi:hypothetical protein